MNARLDDGGRQSAHVVVVGAEPAWAAEELHRRGVEQVTVLSDLPSAGPTLHVASDCGFSAALDRAGRDVVASLDSRLQEIEHNVETGHWALDDPALAVRDAIADSSAVLIGGDGFGPYDLVPLYEAAAATTMARTLGRPVVMATRVGPRVSHWERLLGIVETASVVVAADPGTYGLLARGRPTLRPRRRGHSVLLGVDLALSAPAVLAERPRGMPRGTYVAIALPDRWGLLDPVGFPGDVAALVSELGVMTGLPVVLVPNRGSPGPVSDAVADAVSVLPVQGPAHAASVVRCAALVVAFTREGLLAAHSGAVPTVAVGVDADAQRELAVVQARAGLAGWSVSALGNVVGAAAAEAWERRGELAEAMALLGPDWARTVSDTWDLVVAVARGKRVRRWAAPAQTQTVAPRRPWVKRNVDLVRVVLAAGDRLAFLESELAVERRSTVVLEAQVARLEKECASALDRVSELEGSVILEQEAAAAAREAAASLRHVLGEGTGELWPGQQPEPASDSGRRPLVVESGARVVRAVRRRLRNGNT